MSVENDELIFKMHMEIQKAKNSKGNLQKQQWQICTTQQETNYKAIIIIIEGTNTKIDKATSVTEHSAEKDPNT